MGTLGQDLHYASRLLVRTPGLTAMAVVALALGIGANTAIFSIVNAVLLQPLPFPDPERLVLIWGGRPDQGMEQLPISYPYVTDWKEQARSFGALGTYFSYSDTAVNLTGAGEPERVQGVYATADLFHALGVRPLHGRTFLAEEDVAGSAPVVVVAHALWKRRLGADPSVVGKTISLDGRPRTVVGVMPAGFSFPKYPKDAELWLPLSQDPSTGRQRSRGTNYLTVVARLKPDITLEQAQDEMAAVGRRMEQEHPQFKAGHHVTVVPLHRQVVRELRPALVVLLGAVGFVLLIACADVANLLLARAASRGKEIAIRAALGASHWRLTRQLLTESVLLSLLGGAVGVFLALWAIDLFGFIPYNAPGFLTPWGVTAADVRVDPSVLLFTLGLSSLTGIVFGLAPALHVARLDLRESLGEEWMRSTAGLRRRRLGAALVVAEIALSLMLLIGATLMARSLARLQNVALGFDPADLLTLELNLPRERYPQGAQVTAYYDSVLERLESIPGVIAAGAANILPLSGADESTGFFIEGQVAPPPGEVPHVHPRRISPDYFHAMGTPLRGGRPFSDQDRDGAARVAIINETMARTFFSDRDPIGRRLALDYETMRFFPDRPPQRDFEAGMREIVGVVADTRDLGMEAEPPPQMYVPYAQSPSRDMSLVVRASGGGAAAQVRALRRELAAIDPEQPVSNVRTMEDLLSGSVARPRFNSLLLSCFAGIALALAVVGIYGVMSYSVTQRTREFGIRMALGAQAADVRRIVLRRGASLCAAGLVLGLAGALALTRLLSSLLFGVTPTDPISFLGAASILAGVALLACYLPARRATRVDPMNALRCE